MQHLGDDSDMILKDFNDGGVYLVLFATWAVNGCSLEQQWLLLLGATDLNPSTNAKDDAPLCSGGAMDRNWQATKCSSNFL